MDFLGKHNELESESVAREIWHILIQEHKHKPNLCPLNDMVAVRDFLSTCEFDAVLAKIPRKENDSYILRIRGSDVAIKIHPDIFHECKYIYNTESTLQKLISDGDITHIYKTFTVGGFRVVIYRWQEGIAPTNLMQTAAVDNVRKMLRARIFSLTAKGLAFSGRCEDALIHGDRLIILDPNHLRQESPPLDKEELGELATGRAFILLNEWHMQVIRKRREEAKTKYK